MEWLASLKQRFSHDTDSGLDELIYGERDHKTPVFQRINGHQLVFSLEWHWLASREDRPAIRRAWRESDGAYGALISGRGGDGDESEHAVEHVLGVRAKHKELKRCVRAAAMMSTIMHQSVD